MTTVGYLADVKCTCSRARRAKMAPPLLFVMACLLLAEVAQCMNVVESSHPVKTPSHGLRTGEGDKHEPSVSLMWGIADIMVSEGRFLNYTIPHDAFKGFNLVYKMTEAGKDSLPRWLKFDAEKQLLQGLPTSSDLGQYYMEVIAYGQNGDRAQDIFSIFVNEDSGPASSTLLFKSPSEDATPNSSSPKMIRCKRSEPETAVSVVIDVDLDSHGAAEKLNFLKKVTSHLNLSQDMLKVSRVASKMVNDATVLVSGSGDIKALQSPGSMVSWLVGCGKVAKDHMLVLQQLEEDSKNGVMANAIEHPVHVWYVTNSRFQEHKRRKRQAVRATPVLTPAVTPTLPGKGPTDTIRATATEDAMMHSVPTQSIGIQPTKTMPMEKTAMPGEDKPHGGATHGLPDKTHTMTDRVVPTKTVPKPTESEGEATKGCKDLIPVNTKPIKTLQFIAGEMIRFKIPEETFNDCRVGNTRKLRLSLFMNKTSKMPTDFWLKFDYRKQLVKGLAMKENIGVHRFNLLAINPLTRDTPASNHFSIRIKPDPNARSGTINHELSMSIDYDYDKFNSDIDNRIMFMNKVAQIYGEKNAKQLTLNRVGKGSTIVSWTNKTLASPDCPVDAIKAMMSKLVDDNGKLKQEAIDGMKPFVPKKAGVVPMGSCENNPDFPVLPTTTGDDPVAPDSDGTSDDDSLASPESGPTTVPVAKGAAGTGPGADDIWITTVVPAVVIVAILLIALLIACILYRKKRKGKMNLEDQNTFVNKGVPVIFQDELEEKPNDSTKPLLLEGQPPCPPPEYQRGDSQESTPPVNHKQPHFELEEGHIEDTSVTSPLYQPPPPVTASGGNKQSRPHVAQPAYRTQPPSIPP